jgi:hypothetical protein
MYRVRFAIQAGEAMDEKELKKLETRFRNKTGQDPAVSLPPGGLAVDVPEYVRRAAAIKKRIAEAKAKNDFGEIAHLQGTIQMLKRVVRARAMQAELNRIEKKPGGFITPWPAEEE